MNAIGARTSRIAQLHCDITEESPNRLRFDFIGLLLYYQNNIAIVSINKIVLQ